MSRWRPLGTTAYLVERPVVTTVNVSIPYVAVQEDGSTTRNWAHLTFSSQDGTSIDRRRIKREIRKWVKHNLERTLSTIELCMIMKRTVRPTYK